LSDDLKSLIDVATVSEIDLERTERFLGKLLGSAVAETGELITDKIRFRRFKNQVKILQRAENLLREAGRDPGRVNLKTLVPLVEQASLEETPQIQEMWAMLLARSSQSSARAGLHTICIEILGSISAKEAEILSYILDDYQKRHPELIEKLRKYDKKRTDIHAESLYYRPSDLYKKVGVDSEDGDFLLDNLLRLSVLRYEVPPVEDGDTTFPDYVHLTELGLAVLKECILPIPVNADKGSGTD